MRSCKTCKYSDYKRDNTIAQDRCTTCRPTGTLEYTHWESKQQILERDIVAVLKEKEMVNHPSHYNQGQFEVIDVIYDWNLNFSLGSALKYIARCDAKDKPIEDLKKAIQYIEFEIKEREKDNETR